MHPHFPIFLSLMPLFSTHAHMCFILQQVSKSKIVSKTKIIKKFIIATT